MPEKKKENTDGAKCNGEDRSGWRVEGFGKLNVKCDKKPRTKQTPERDCVLRNCLRFLAFSW